MGAPRREVAERKLAFLRRFLDDLRPYARLEAAQRRREHYAIERLLRLLCESAAEMGFQFLKAEGWGLAASYRDVFATLARHEVLPVDLAERPIEACAMRNLLTPLHETIDEDRVIAAVEPALEVYGRFLDWAVSRPEPAQAERITAPRTVLRSGRKC